MTLNAITKNREWNTKIVATKEGAVVKDILTEFNVLWNDVHSINYDEIKHDYHEKYLESSLIKKQQKIAREESIVNFECYTLKPNKMQVAFIDNLKTMLRNGVERALLISATG